MQDAQGFGLRGDELPQDLDVVLSAPAAAGEERVAHEKVDREEPVVAGSAEEGIARAAPLQDVVSSTSQEVNSALAAQTLVLGNEPVVPGSAAQPVKPMAVCEQRVVPWAAEK